MPIAPSLAKGLRAVALVAALCSMLAACGSEDCANNDDCPAGRICRLGLCALDPGGDVGGGDALPDIPLDCLVAGPDDLVMTEILADPPSGADIDGNGTPSATGDEFVEVVNVAARPVALTNVQIEVGSKRVAIGSVCLNPYQARVLFGSGGLPGLTNSGGTVSLVVDGQVVQSHTYGSEGGRDSSLTLERQLDKTSPWVLHKDVAPTAYSPGTCYNGNEFPDCEGASPNPDAEVIGDSEVVTPSCSVVPVPGNLIINEVLADPTGLDANGDGVPNGGNNGADEEFIEIVNVSANTLLLDGLVYRDAGTKVFNLPSGQCLAPNQALILFGKYEGTGNFGNAIVLHANGLSLNNEDETVTISDAQGTTLASATWGKTVANGDQAIVRETDLSASASFVRHTLAPNANGAKMSPGFCQNGNPFPDCGSVVVPTDVVDATDTSDTSDVSDTTETIDDVGPTCGPLVAAGDLVINEVMANPGDVLDWNGDDQPHTSQDEYVEIVSTASGPVLLQGLKVADTTSTGSITDKYTFGAICIEPGEAIVVFGVGVKHYKSSGIVQVDTATHSLSVNNSGDETIYLRFSAENVLASFSFNIASSAPAQTAAIGVARARGPDLSGAIGPHPELSSGRKGSPGLCNDNGLPFPGCLTP